MNQMTITGEQALTLEERIRRERLYRQAHGHETIPAVTLTQHGDGTLVIACDDWTFEAAFDGAVTVTA